MAKTRHVNRFSIADIELRNIVLLRNNEALKRLTQYHFLLIKNAKYLNFKDTKKVRVNAKQQDVAYTRAIYTL